MNSHRLRRLLFISTLVVATIITLSLMSGTSVSKKRQLTFKLQAPAFIRTAYAQENPTAFDLGAYLDQEAGISAYYKSPDAITLSQVRGQFRTIETETADYIIGSVAVLNYEEHFDVHVYVHKTGWILAYYLRADPVSKIIDVKAMTLNTTKLKSVISSVAGAAGAPFTDVTYYDFRYPNATNLIFVAEDVSNGDDFTIQLPSSFGYFERSWALYAAGYPDYFKVDGLNVPNQIYNQSASVYGTLTASQLLPDTPHIINADNYGVLVIVYRVP